MLQVFDGHHGARVEHNEGGARDQHDEGGDLGKGQNHGKVGEKGQSRDRPRLPTVRCFSCGGPHFASLCANCPHFQAQGQGKGKGQGKGRPEGMRRPYVSVHHERQLQLLEDPLSWHCSLCQNHNYAMRDYCHNYHSRGCLGTKAESVCYYCSSPYHYYYQCPTG